MLRLFVVCLSVGTLAVPTKTLLTLGARTIETAQLVTLIAVTLDKGNEEDQLRVGIPFALVEDIHDHPLLHQDVKTLQEDMKNGMVVSGLVHIFIELCFLSFIIRLHIHLVGSDMTGLDEDLLASGVFFCVIGDISEGLPRIFFVTCTTIKDTNGHLQCCNLQLIILAGHSTINVKRYGDENLLVGFGDEPLVRLQVCPACVDILDVGQILWGRCKRIIVEEQPIFVLPPWIRQQGHHIIMCTLLPHFYLGFGVW